jgi:hypothetical protein
MLYKFANNQFFISSKKQFKEDKNKIFVKLVRGYENKVTDFIYDNKTLACNIIKYLPIQDYVVYGSEKSIPGSILKSENLETLEDVIKNIDFNIMKYRVYEKYKDSLSGLLLKEICENEILVIKDELFIKLEQMIKEYSLYIEKYSRYVIVYENLHGVSFNEKDIDEWRINNPDDFTKTKEMIMVKYPLFKYFKNYLTADLIDDLSNYINLINGGKNV